MRDYFLKTRRIGFSVWQESDLELARQLWGEADVTRFICATGRFTEEDIARRLETERRNEERYHIQYWPIFALATGELIGCCGLRPFQAERDVYELGFHLRRRYWGKGYAFEAAEAAIGYGFERLHAAGLYAGHHPENAASERLLKKLGFRPIGLDFYEPTGRYHPSYELRAEEWARRGQLRMEEKTTC